MVSIVWFLLILSTCCWLCFARRMLEELIDVLKAKGVPNVVPELLPKGMKWRDVLAFVQKYPRTHLPIRNDRVRSKTNSLSLCCAEHAHFFSLGFMATHAIETMVRQNFTFTIAFGRCAECLGERFR